MRSYGQYCPIARASELLAERWSIIILRNIIVDRWMRMRFNAVPLAALPAGGGVLR